MQYKLTTLKRLTSEFETGSGVTTQGMVADKEINEIGVI